MAWGSAAGATAGSSSSARTAASASSTPPSSSSSHRHPFEVAQAVIDTYSKQGPAAINVVPGEMERLKWVGIYPQRQGGDAFMMRIKVPGGS